MSGGTHRAAVETVLGRYQPIDRRTRATEYRNTGWRAFNEKAGPYRPNASEVERIRRKWSDAA